MPVLPPLIYPAFLPIFPNTVLLRILFFLVIFVTGTLCGNDLCAQGFVAAAKSAGKEAGDIGIVGIDGSVDSIALIKEGWQTATSAQSFGKIGRASVEMMLKVLAGEELEERDILIPVELVDAENVEDYVFD